MSAALKVRTVARELRIEAIVERDGEIYLRSLPYRRGEKVEMNVRPVEPGGGRKPPLTARRLLDFGLVGMWEHRDDVGDSVTSHAYIQPPQDHGLVSLQRQPVNRAKADKRFFIASF